MNFVLVIGTLVMLLMAVSLVGFMVLYQRKMIKFNERLKKNEAERQEMMLKASINIQEAERNRIAADLHDEIGPMFATAKLYLNDNLIHQPPQEQLEILQAAKKIIDNGIVQLRNISHNLLPPSLKNFGLANACEDLFNKINDSGSIEAICKFYNYHKRLNPEQELVVFRIVQELIHNIFKHSHASFIHLIQNVANNKMYFKLSHDGTGLVQAQFNELTNSQEGLGLKNINNRLSISNGKIFFEKDLYLQNFSITLEIPML